MRYNDVQLLSLFRWSGAQAAGGAYHAPDSAAPKVPEAQEAYVPFRTEVLHIMFAIGVAHTDPAGPVKLGWRLRKTGANAANIVDVTADQDKLTIWKANGDYGDLGGLEGYGDLVEAIKTENLKAKPLILEAGDIWRVDISPSVAFAGANWRFKAAVYGRIIGGKE